MLVLPSLSTRLPSGYLNEVQRELSTCTPHYEVFKNKVLVEAVHDDINNLSPAHQDIKYRDPLRVVVFLLLANAGEDLRVAPQSLPSAYVLHPHFLLNA